MKFVYVCAAARMTGQQLAQFVGARYGIDPARVQVTTRRIGGGLECAVWLATLQGTGSSAALPPLLVVKELPGSHRRELTAYELVGRLLDPAPAPRLVGVEHEPDRAFLILEHVQAAHRWPWSSTTAAEAVCGAMARVHGIQGAAVGSSLDDWNYEQELQASAESTLAFATSACRAGASRYWQRLGALRRVVEALPGIRAELLAHRVLLHGDVHPGNVMLRAADAQDVVFIDWGRARVGSPFEDVASWLQSLGAWEPQARRFHDTLLRAYLKASGHDGALAHVVRRQYWLAGACNGLAGAIRYYLWRACDPEVPEIGKVEAARALHAWQRVIRQAARVVDKGAPAGV